VRIGGGLAGYRWGIERKRTLLEREHALPAGQKAA
jgi:O6-methylguanine-DNA--protein-cysteine methyltransferase